MTARELWRLQLLSEGDGPFAQQTLLGWGIIGSNVDHDDSATCHRITSESMIDIKDIGSGGTVPGFEAKSTFDSTDSPMINDKYDPYEIEAHADELIDRKLSYDDFKFLDIMEKNICVNDDGHFEMPLPFKTTTDPIMPNNKEIALKRLNGLKIRMKSHEQYKQEYVDFMEGIIDKGYAEKCTTEPEEGKVWYIPHHGVFHPTKKKLRVVFDCACEFLGSSLNDKLLSGPDLTGI